MAMDDIRRITPRDVLKAFGMRIVESESMPDDDIRVIQVNDDGEVEIVGIIRVPASGEVKGGE